MNAFVYTPELLNREIGLVLPELLLAVGSMALLVLGVFRSGNPTRSIAWLTVVMLGVALLLVLALPQGTALAFGGVFVADGFAKFMKVLVLAGSALAIVMSLHYLEKEKLDRFEFPILIGLSTLGMLMMISANDLISLYIGLELMSLALYVLAAFNRDSLRSTESGLKYFVLGALSSGLLLYGASLIYGFTGTTLFPEIAQVVSSGDTSVGVVFGLVFVMAGLAFKISAVPFHMWTPDVYEGAPTPVTAFFAVAPKIAAVAVFARFLMSAFPDAVDEWRQVIVFISVLSMFLGAFAAIGQTNIKRLMAYSTIAHMGYMLVGLAAGSAAGLQGVVVYMAVYLVTNIGVFVCILSMRRKEGMVEQIDDLSGLSRTRPLMAFAIATFMFSLAGIPPLAGFLAKWFVFVPAIEAGLWPLVVIGVLTSVVSAFYYLRIVKVMYFDEPAEAFVRQSGTGMTAIMVASTAGTLLFALFAFPVLQLAMGAAQSLMAGGL